eukprot:scaffold54078_cov18-Tisochrysis_lutea.AAC.1
MQPGHSAHESCQQTDRTHGTSNAHACNRGTHSAYNAESEYYFTRLALKEGNQYWRAPLYKGG